MIPAESWLPASDGPTVSTVGSSKAIGRAPNFRLVARLLRRGLGEVAADLGLTVGDDPVHRRRGEDLAVEHDRELPVGAVEGAGDLGEGLGALGVEVELDHPLHALLVRRAGVGAVPAGCPRSSPTERRYLLPLPSQVISGWSGSSTTLVDSPAGGAGELVELRDPRLVGVLRPRERVVDVGRARIGPGRRRGVRARRGARGVRTARSRRCGRGWPSAGPRAPGRGAVALVDRRAGLGLGEGWRCRTGGARRSRATRCRGRLDCPRPCRGPPWRRPGTAAGPGASPSRPGRRGSRRGSPRRCSGCCCWSPRPRRHRSR